MAWATTKLMIADPLTIVFAGIALVFLGIALMVLVAGGGRAEGGAVVVIGPIPIVFGSSRNAALVAAALAVAVIIAFLVLSLVVR